MRLREHLFAAGPPIPHLALSKNRQCFVSSMCSASNFAVSVANCFACNDRVCISTGTIKYFGEFCPICARLDCVQSGNDPISAEDAEQSGEQEYRIYAG